MAEKSLSERVESLKTREDRLYYEISLRDDLANLIATGLERSGGMTQRSLAEMTGCKESYISRLMNAATNFKINAAARVLVPLGIIPVLVDKAELDKLRQQAENQGSRQIPTHETVESYKAQVVKNGRTYEAGILPGPTRFVFPTPGSPYSMGRTYPAVST